MKFEKYIQPAFEGENGAGTSPAAPPSAPPSNPTDLNPEAISSSDEWVLGQFDAMVADDNSEDIEIVEPVAPIPNQVSAQAGNPEPATPASVPTGNGQEPPRAVATPLPVVSAPTAPAPQVGVSGNQPAGQVATQPPPPLDPTSIMSQLAAGMLAQREGLIDQLAKRYEMSEADADKLGFTTEQAKFLARMKAEAQFEAVSSLTHMQAEQLPAFLNGHIEARTANQRKEDEFFGEWSQLRSVPKDKLGQVLEMTSKLHPTLRGAEWRKKAGELACVSFGLSPVPTPVGSNGQPSAQPAVRTPGPVVRATGGLPHLPAGTSTTPASGQPQMTEAERFFRLLQATDAGEFET